MRQTITAGLTFVLAAGLARATDRWEAGTFNNDAGALTANVLTHGTVQWAHDLQGAPDQDWMVVKTNARRSYEARVRSSTVRWDGVSCTVNCTRFDRVDSLGSVLTSGLLDGPPIGSSLHWGSSVVRWIAAADSTEFVRVHGGVTLTASDQYDVEFFDTTLFAPRFNNTSSQITVVIVQNTTPGGVSASVHFYHSNGNLLHSEPVSIGGAYGSHVFNTGLIPALQNQSGTISIAHNSGYGGVAGKAVALEPATGFTFDTPFVPLPR